MIGIRFWDISFVNKFDIDILPAPYLLANDIIENLGAAVESFKEIIW